MRVQAIRASESLYKAGDMSFDADVRELAKDTDTQVVIQALLTLNLLKVPDVKDVVRAAQAANKRARGEGDRRSDCRSADRATFGGSGFARDDRRTADRGPGRARRTYAELCYACHGADGKGAPMAGAPAGTKLAPPLAGSPRVQGHRDYAIKVAAARPDRARIDGNTYPGVMAADGRRTTDEWVANVASYIRNAWGNSAAFVTPADVARVRAATPGRTRFLDDRGDRAHAAGAAARARELEGDRQPQRTDRGRARSR